MTNTLMIDRRALMAAFAALAVPAGAGAATAEKYPAIKAFIDSYVDSKKLPGVVAAIKHGDAPVQYLSAGTLGFDTSAPARPDSLFRIYSMTKPITGMAAMKLVEDGKLGLDQPLGDILPDFKDMKVLVNPATMETRPAASLILIRHLLTHTAGFNYATIGRGPLAQLYAKNGIKPGGRDTEPGPGELPPARDLVTFGKRLSALPLDFDPGARWQYSVALDLTGLVIQTVSGVSFYDYLRTHFFEPLKMHDTDFMVPKSKLDRFTTEVTMTKEGKVIVVDDRKSSPFARDRDIQSGGAGLVSSAHDYIRFTSMLLNEGTLDGVRVVKPETVRTAHSNLMNPGVRFGGKNAFGAAVAVVLPGGEAPGQEPAGSYWWFGIAGTQMWVDPSNRFSVALMLQEYPTTYPVRQEIRIAAYKDLAAMKA